ncbi:hypothetical protein HK405_001230, partial [Cladochytrium tenue]
MAATTFPVDALKLPVASDLSPPQHGPTTQAAHRRASPSGAWTSLVMAIQPTSPPKGAAGPDGLWRPLKWTNSDPEQFA